MNMTPDMQRMSVEKWNLRLDKDAIAAEHSFAELRKKQNDEFWRRAVEKYARHVEDTLMHRFHDFARTPLDMLLELIEEGSNRIPFPSPTGLQQADVYDVGTCLLSVPRGLPSSIDGACFAERGGRE